MSITFIICNNDPRYPLVKGNYNRLSKNSSESEYYASNFLHDKLSSYDDVVNVEYYPIWIVNETFVVKMFLEYDLFKNALKVQTILSKEGIACNIIDIWHNGSENFIISEYGGVSLETTSAEEVEDQVQSIRDRLSQLNMVMTDDHKANYVQDKNGKVRIIDYESIQFL